MKTNIYARITAIITVCVFSWTSVAHSAPIDSIWLSQPGNQRLKSPWHIVDQTTGERLDLTLPFASNRYLAPQPLATVLEWLQPLIDSSQDPEKTARYAQSFFKRSGELSARSRFLIELMNDPALLAELGIDREDARALYDENSRYTVTRSGSTLKERRAQQIHARRTVGNFRLEELEKALAKKTVSALRPFLDDKQYRGSVTVRLRVIDGLAQIGSKTAYRLIGSFYKDPDWRVRRHAAGALIDSGDDQVHKALHFFANDTKPDVLFTLLEFCGSSNTGWTVSMFEELFFAKRPLVIQSSMIRAFEKNASEEALRSLFILRFVPDERIQKEARSAYEKVFTAHSRGSDYDGLFRILLSLADNGRFDHLRNYIYHDDPLVAREAIRLLGRSSRSEDLATLIDIIRAKAPDGRQWYALDAVRVFGARADAVAALDELISEGTAAIDETVLKRVKNRIAERARGRQKNWREGLLPRLLSVLVIMGISFSARTLQAADLYSDSVRAGIFGTLDGFMNIISSITQVLIGAGPVQIIAVGIIIVFGGTIAGAFSLFALHSLLSFHRDTGFFKSRKGRLLLGAIAAVLIAPMVIYGTLQFQTARNEAKIMNLGSTEATVRGESEKKLILKGLYSNRPEVRIQTLRHVAAFDAFDQITTVQESFVGEKDVRVKNAYYDFFEHARDERFVPVLRERLFSPFLSEDEILRITHILALSEGARASAVLEEALVYQASDVIRDGAFEAVRRSGTVSDEQRIRYYIADLRTYMGERAYQRGQNAQRALIALGARSEEALVELLRDSAHQVREKAQETLRLMELMKAEYRLIKLEADLVDDLSVYREIAMKELSEINAYTPSRAARKLLADYMDSLDPFNPVSNKKAEAALLRLGTPALAVIEESFYDLELSSVARENLEELERSLKATYGREERAPRSDGFLKDLGVLAIALFFFFFPSGAQAAGPMTHAAVFTQDLFLSVIVGVGILSAWLLVTKNYRRGIYFFHLLRAYRFVRAGNDTAAVAAFESAQAAMPLGLDPALMLARAYLRLGDTDKTLSVLLFARKNYSLRYDQAALFSDVYVAKGDIEQAIGWAEKAVAKNLKDMSLHMRLSALYERAERFNDARRTLLSIPGEINPYTEEPSGRVQQALDRLEESRKRRLVELLRGARALYEDKKYVDALETLNKVIRIDPYNVAAYILIARIFLSKEEYFLGRAYLGHALKLVPESKRIKKLDAELRRRLENRFVSREKSLVDVRFPEAFMSAETQVNTIALRTAVERVIRRLKPIQNGSDDYARFNYEHLRKAQLWGDLDTLGAFREREYAHEYVRSWLEFIDWELPDLFMHDMTFISPLALENQLVLEGTLIHEHIHSLLRASAYSPQLKDTIAAVIELRYIFTESFARERAEGKDPGTTFTETMDFLRIEDESMRLSAPLKHMLDLYSRYQGETLTRMVEAIGAFAVNRHDGAPLEAAPAAIAAMIEGLEDEIFIGGTRSTLIEEIKESVLHSRTRFMAEKGLFEEQQEKRVVIIDGRSAIDVSLFKDLLNAERRVFLIVHDHHEKGSTHYVELDARGSGIPDLEAAFQRTDGFDAAIAEIKAACPDFSINVVSGDDPLLSEVTVTDVELFSTRLAYERFADDTVESVSFESVIVPFVLTVDRRILHEKYEGIYNIFIKRSRLWRVNPEYVATLSTVSLADAYETLTRSIRSAIEEAVKMRFIQTSA
jgi:HEAT repeat protein/tetratricopeptide (TPR) repeat protein